MSLPIDPHLPPIVPPNAPRVAEAADARLPIREHEEQAKRKKDNDQKKETVLPEDSYDQTILGVRALIDFLKNFVHNVNPAQKSGTITGRDSPEAISPKTSTDPAITGAVDPERTRTSFHQPPPENIASAHAASAYRHGAAIQNTGPGGPRHRPDMPLGGAAALIDNGEVRQIHRVIALLEDLEKRGVQGLRLERAESFVTAIENAARRAVTE